MLGEISLLELVLGGAIGTGMTQLPASYRYLRILVKGDRILGTWHHHFINRDDDGVSLRIDTMEVSRGFRKSITFTRIPNNHTGDSYKGYITKEKNFFITVCWAENDDEFIVQRYKNTPVQESDSLISLSLAQNYRGQASVNPTVLCRDKLDEDTFFSLVKSAIRVDSPNRILFIE